MSLKAFLLEFSALIQQAWPEIPGLSAEPIQLYTSVQALKQSFVEQLRINDANPEDGIKLPCVCIWVGRDVQSSIGVATGIYRRPVRVFYVARELTPQETIHAKLQALRALVEQVDAEYETFAFPPERATIDTSDESDVNRNLIGDSAVRIVSGHIEWTPGLLVFDSD